MARKTISQKVKKAVQNYVDHLKQNGLSIKDVFLYGSYAKGTASKLSDIDVCVISDDFQKIKDPWAFLWIKKRKKDVEAMIAPVGFSSKDFINEDPLAWEIKTTGIKIPV